MAYKTRPDINGGAAGGGRSNTPARQFPNARIESQLSTVATRWPNDGYAAGANPILIEKMQGRTRFFASLSVGVRYLVAHEINRRHRKVTAPTQGQ